MTDYVIIWDMDETLGSFKKIGYELAGWGLAESTAEPGLRPGMLEVLDDLKGDGFKHYICTTNGRETTDLILSRSGLESHIDHYMTGEDGVRGEEGRNHAPFYERAGLNDEDVPKRAFAIGDGFRDYSDSYDTVFINVELPTVELGRLGEDKEVRMQSATVLKDIMYHVKEAGDGDISAGFEALYNVAGAANAEYIEDVRNGAEDVKIYSADGLTFSMGYIQRHGAEPVPTIFDIKAETVPVKTI